MISVILYAVLIAIFYFIDMQLNMPFLITQQIEGICNIFDIPENCIYLMNSTETQVTFTIQFMHPNMEMQVFYQYLKQDIQVDDLQLSSDKDHFPIAAFNEETQGELEGLALRITDYETKTKGGTRYVEVSPDVKVYSYTLFTKHLIGDIQMVHKNNLKYTEDSFVTFLGFLCILITIKKLPQQDETTGVYRYLQDNQINILLVIGLLTQPLRPLCFLKEFEQIEWLLGQGCYAIGECGFLIYYLQILQFMRGRNEHTSRIRNIVMAWLVVVPISFDRFLVAFTSYSRVVVSISDQVEYIDYLMILCWWLILLLVGLSIYEILMALQGNKYDLQIILIDIGFLVIYTLQKSHFYLYYENYSHHLFNPVNMLLMITYLCILITLQQDVQKQQQIKCEQEMESKRLHLEEDDEARIDVLENEIAAYYQEGKDVLI